MNKDFLLIGAALGGAYLLYQKVNLNPLSKDNVFNSAVNSAYQKITGSVQSPGEDIADYVYKDADEKSIGVLTDYFSKQGVTDASKAKAVDMGWTQNDIVRATAAIDMNYSTQQMYELPPII